MVQLVFIIMLRTGVDTVGSWVPPPQSAKNNELTQQKCAEVTDMITLYSDWGFVPGPLLLCTILVYLLAQKISESASEETEVKVNSNGQPF